MPEPPRFAGQRFASVEAALADGPKFFEDLMTAVGSRDGREVVRALEALRDKVPLDRDAEGRYLIKTRCRSHCVVIRAQKGDDRMNAAPSAPPARVPRRRGGAAPHAARRSPSRSAWCARSPTATILWALEKGYFKEYGIKVETEDLDTSANSIALLAQNQLQIIEGGISAGYFNALEKNLPITIVRRPRLDADRPQPDAAPRPQGTRSRR